MDEDSWLDGAYEDRYHLDDASEWEEDQVKRDEQAEWEEGEEDGEEMLDGEEIDYPEDRWYFEDQHLDGMGEM